MELFEEIVKAINEELGISDLVTITVNDIISQIINDQKKYPNNKIKTGILNNCNLFGKKVDINYTLYFCDDENQLNNITNINTGKNKIVKNKYIIYTTICYIKSLNKYIDFKGTTQHEIEHLYQIIQSNKSFLYKPKTEKIYNTSLQLAKYGSHYEKIVGYTIYYNCKFEKNAFGNETYRQLIDFPNNDPMKLIKQTTLYNNLKIIDDCCKHISPIEKQTIEHIVFVNFNKHFNWWFNKAKKLIDEYVTTIGKIIVKTQKDLNEETVLDNFIHEKIKQFPQFIEDF